MSLFHEIYGAQRDAIMIAIARYRDLERHPQRYGLVATGANVQAGMEAIDAKKKPKPRPRPKPGGGY